MSAMPLRRSSIIAPTAGRAVQRVIAGSMRLQLVEARADAIAPIWREIEDRVGTGGLACSWAWTETWLRHYGDLVPHRFVIAERNGPCAIALVTEGVGKVRGPFTIRSLHLGTAGEPDDGTVRIQYNRLLVGPADRGPFLRGLMTLITDSDLRWEEFHLDGFPPDEVAPLIDEDFGFETFARPSHLTDLKAIRDTGGTVLAALGGVGGKKVRRAVRMIEEALGPLSVEWAESPTQAREIYDEMVSLHKARWIADGEPGVFANKRFAAFHDEIVDRLFPAGAVLLARVRAGDVTIGCDYSFIERNRILGYQWGVARLEDTRLSPGLVTGVAIMQAALERGLDEYDWLTGDVLYKRQLTNASRELVWSRSSRGARIKAIYKLAEAKRLASRLQSLRPILGEAGS